MKKAVENRTVSAAAGAQGPRRTVGLKPAAALKPVAAPTGRQKFVARPAAETDQTGKTSQAGSPVTAGKRRRNWPILEVALILVVIKIAAGAFYIWNRPAESGRESLVSPRVSLPAAQVPAAAAEPPEVAARPADYLGAALKATQPAQAQAAPVPITAGISALSAGAFMVVGQSATSRATDSIPLAPGEEGLWQPAARLPQTPSPQLGSDLNAVAAAPGAGPNFEALRHLREREQELARREAQLVSKAGALGALEAELSRRLEETELAKREIEAMLKRNEAVLVEQRALAEQQQAEDEALKEARLQHLVAAYGGMKAEQAGILINSMDDDVAVAILSAMPGGKAGKILAMVNPDKAARLTKAISEKRIDPNLLLSEDGGLSAGTM